MAAPDWLTEEYILKALRAYHKDTSLTLNSLQINAALGKGENFGGVLTRIKAQYQLQNGKQTLNKAFILKTSFEEDEFAREKMKDYDIFTREMSIYEQVLPKLTELLHEINDADELFAEAVHVDYARQALIFEDLSERGFVMADRKECLSLQHVKLVLRKLAKMHATSAQLNQIENHRLEQYDRGFFNRYTDTYSTYFVGMLVACTKHLSQWPDYAYYHKKLLALAPHYMKIGKHCFAPKLGNINVLAHGDVWTNNVMFKYDACGKPVDAIIIDFQYSFWGSPALDLHHFFNTSLQEHLRLHQQHTLVQFYHRIFADTLRKLNYRAHPIPSLHAFTLQVEEKRFFAFHSSCIIQPVMINEGEDGDFSAFMAEDDRANNFRRSLYYNKKVEQNLKNLLPIFDSMGLIDANQCD